MKGCRRSIKVESLLLTAKPERMDARALLRATKGAAAGASSAGDDSQSRSGKGAIRDRFASYNSKTGALRCAACSYLTIKHDNLWTSHAASKSHRQNVAAILAKEEKEEEERRRKAEQEELTAKSSIAGGKRKAADHDGPNGDADASEETKKQKLAATASASVPADPASEAEWEAFQREILSASNPTGTGTDEDYKKFAAATIEAAPVLRRRDGDEEDEDLVEEEQPIEKTEEELEEERRQKKEQEEKEEIMERYEEEVRAQQEANDR